MKILNWKCTREVNVNINKYLFDNNKKVSKGQRILQDFLLQFWKNEILLQEFRIPGCLKRIDLMACCRCIAVEFSPKSHHAKYNPFFHGGSKLGYLKTIKADIEKEAWATKNGYKWVEITDEDLPNLSYKFFKDNFDIDLI